MDDSKSPKRLCLHCEKVIPYRTYMNHKQRFRDVNGQWQKDTSLQHSSDEDIQLDPSSDEFTQASSDEGEVCDQPSNIEINNEYEYLELAQAEIWKEEQTCDIEEDFVDKCFSESVRVPVGEPISYAIQPVILQWFLVGLSHFWSVFRIPDRAIEFLIIFLKRLFQVMSWSNNWFQAIVSGFPSSLYNLKKEFNLLDDKFKKYVVCQKCHSIYNFEDCFHFAEGRNVSKKCAFVKFPNHRQKWRRKKCGAPLLKEVTLKDGSKRLYPHKVYCYRSLIKTLQTFVSRSGFVEKCELWRKREIRSFAQVLCDVFEGRIWKDFQSVDGSQFLAEPRNYAFMLNVDWMQPFAHVTYSVGVLYLCLMNLPRSERYKRENIFLVGIIPGPSKPPLTINTYLAPLVDELLVLWNTGVTMKHSGSLLYPQLFKAALLCVACDVPAARKVCGFTAHASAAGCSKCKKYFPGGFGEPTNYSGFNPCPPRQNDEHRRQATEIRNQTSQDDADKVTSLYGTRYTELHRLPYFDCVRFTIVDPMHTLFLGTAKRMLEIWLEERHLDACDLQAVQDLVDRTQVPSNIGRLPYKIARSFGGFTAEQWKSWTTVFSLFALLNKLESQFYRSWSLFVRACRIYSSSMIKVKDVGVAHSFMLQFCKEFERLYGCAKVTPNMHLHTHLADCILDYGPVQSFWLFSFERYNGILGNYQNNNNKSVEIQIIRKFLRDQHLDDLPLPITYRENFEQVFHRTDAQVLENRGECKLVMDLLQLREGDLQVGNELWFEIDTYKCGLPHTVDTFDDDELSYVTKAYQILVPQISEGDVPLLFDRYSSVEFAGEVYNSARSRHKTTGNILAKWAGRYDVEVDPSSDIRPGTVHYFIKQKVTVNGREINFLFARVSWYQYHPEIHACGTCPDFPEIWCSNLYKPFGPASFLPVQRIFGKFVTGDDCINGENVLFVLPLVKQIFV